jgi:hypothetical protein
MLAHGGTAGAAAEIAFIVVPIAVFSILSGVSRRRREREEAQAEAADADPEGTP